MPKLNQRGVVHLLVPLILLLGIIAGVYLIKTGNLKLFSKATNPPIVFKNLQGQVITTTTSSSVKIEFTSTLGSPKTSTNVSAPVRTYTEFLRFAENPTALDKATFIPYLTEPTSFNYSFNPSPGMKFMWVEFKDNTGKTDRKTAQIEIISATSSPTPKPITDTTRTIKVWVLDHHEVDYYHPYVNPNPIEFTRNELLPALNEASKYHGYSNPSAQPALNYTLFDSKQVNNATDPVILDGNGYYDYDKSLFQRYDLCNYAKKNDIKVVMIWGVGKWESIVTGSKGIPTNGAVMSSLCPDKTIVVYGLNYGRGLQEAMEAVSHHYESVFRRFRPEYASWSGESSPQNTNLVGRGDTCGTSHNPPNARCEYDRSNSDGWLECGSASAPAFVLSDCWNWKPDRSGVKESLDCNAWNCKTSGDAGWLKWWMQNMPGIGNNLVGTDGQKIPNWWVYIADPDNCYNNPFCGQAPTPTVVPTSTPTPTIIPTPSPTPKPTTIPALYSRIFVTSTLYDGNLGGLAGADAKCQERANAAKLGGTWKAWLSDGTISAASRLNHSNVPYKLINGTSIANSWTELISGTLKAPINVTEINTTVANGNPWTNTNSNGTIRSTDAPAHCINWTATTSSDYPKYFWGVVGLTRSTVSSWTFYAGLPCNQALNLYCFEQLDNATPTPSPTPKPTPPSSCTLCSADLNKDKYVNGMDVSFLIPCYNKKTTDEDWSGQSCANRDANGDGKIDFSDVSCIQKFMWQEAKNCQPTPTPSPTPKPTPKPTPTPQPSKRVFITSTTYNGNLGGLFGADAKCKERANIAGLGGIWKAWLSDSKTSASSRSTHSGPYVLLNGTKVFTGWGSSWGGILYGSPLSPINLTELKTASSSNVWTNTNYIGGVTNKTVTQVCGNWTTGGNYNYGYYGVSSERSILWTAKARQTCNNLYSLYCFEQ